MIVYKYHSIKKFVHGFYELRNYNFMVQMIKNIKQCNENIAWMIFGWEKHYRFILGFFFLFKIKMIVYCSIEKFVHDFYELRNYNFIVQMIKNVEQCNESIAWMIFGQEKDYKFILGFFFSLKSNIKMIVYKYRSIKKFLHGFYELRNYNFIVQMIKNVEQYNESIAWMMFGQEKDYRFILKSNVKMIVYKYRSIEEIRFQRAWKL